MYESFASVYDLFMDDVPYLVWGAHIVSCLRREGITDGLVLDLGCGTGKITRYLARAGYDLIGADASEEMLQIAGESEVCEPLGILYLQQDMRSFELYGTVRAVVCCCDCLNYLLAPEELQTVFSLVNNYLDPGGLFMFDMNTPWKYRNLLGDQTFAQTREEGAYIWENTWYEEENINGYDLTLFIREETAKGTVKEPLYRRYHEEHFQRAYTPETVRELLRAAGLLPLGVYDGYGKDLLKPESERMLWIAREQGK